MLRLLIPPLMLLAAPLSAQTPDCTNAPVLEEPWASWPQSGDAIAGGTVDGAPRLILGKPIVATLRPAVQVQFPITPGKSDPKSFGGLLTLSLKIPARVGIALSGPAWVDVVRGDAALQSVEHGHGPACSGIRKIVWFDLPAGLVTVQISNAPGETVRVMAADAAAHQLPGA